MSYVTVDGSAYYGDKQPELRYSSTGNPMLFFRVGFYQGKDKDRGYIDVATFGDLAEHVAESIQHGDNVVVTGRLSYRKWDNADGISMSRISIVADTVGASMRWGTVNPVRVERTERFAGNGDAPSMDALEAPF